MSVRTGPPGSARGGPLPRETASTAQNAAAAKLQVPPKSTTARRQEWLGALPRQRTERVQELRRALDGARRRGDLESARLLCAWIDAEFVADAHRRAADPEIRRLRRQLRAAA